MDRFSDGTTDVATQAQEAFVNVWQQFLEYLPEIIAAIIILVIGYIIGVVLGKIVARIIRATKVDSYLKETSLDETLNKGGVALDTGRFIGGIIKWLVIIAAFITALGILGLDAVNDFMQNVLNYIPNIIAAILILLVAAVAGEFVRKVIIASTRIASLGVSSNMLGSVAKWAIWILGIMAALTQLGIAEDLIQSLFTAVVAGGALAFGLAFGLGGRDHAKAMLDRMSDQVRGARTTNEQVNDRRDHRGM